MSLFEREGAAFVRTKTTAGVPIEWRHTHPKFELADVAYPDIPEDHVRKALQAAIDSWEGPAGHCNTPPMNLDTRSSEHHEVGMDGRHLIVWRLPGYCSDPANMDAEVCASPT